MKRFLLALAIAASTLGPQAQATDVGVSVNIGQPGFYGRLDIGGFPPPVLVYPQPVTIQRVAPGQPPLYLHVPPGHARHWRKHCHKYSACGEQVYFVRNNWYQREYVPRYREEQQRHRGDNGDNYRDDHRRGEQRGRHRDDDHGHGHGQRH